MSEELNTGADAGQPTGVTQAADVSGAEPTQTNSAPAAPAAEKPDYSFVPPKFLNEDGTPDFKKLSTSYSNLEKKIGQKPNIGASSIDEYDFNFGEGFEVDNERGTAFKQKALELGFSKLQYDLVMETHKAMIEANTWTADKSEQALKQAWGNEYESQTKAALRAFGEFAPSDVNPHDPVWNHPSVMKLLARLGAEVGEDTVGGKNGGTQAQAMTEAEVAELMRSADYRAGNKELHAKVTQWYQSKYK